MPCSELGESVAVAIGAPRVRAAYDSTGLGILTP